MACYTAQFNHDCQIDVSVGLSPGYQAQKIFAKLQYSKVYAQFMLMNIKRRVILPNIELLCEANGIRRQHLLEARSLNYLEEELYSKVNGYESFDDYWKDNDPVYGWGKMKVPFLCINSLDDPVCEKEFIQFDEFKNHPNTILLTTDKGGHCGFYENLDSKSWSYDVAIDFIIHSFEYLDFKAK